MANIVTANKNIFIDLMQKHCLTWEKMDASSLTDTEKLMFSWWFSQEYENPICLQQ